MRAAHGRRASAPRAPRAARLMRRAWLRRGRVIEKAAFTRADLVEIVGAQLPVDTEHAPREARRERGRPDRDAADRAARRRISAKATNGSPSTASWPKKPRSLS